MTILAMPFNIPYITKILFSLLFHSSYLMRTDFINPQEDMHEKHKLWLKELELLNLLF